MTPIKAANAPHNFFGGGPGTATVSAMMGSIDGEEYDSRLNSERDEDNIT